MGDLDLPFIQAAAHGKEFGLPVHIRVIHSTEGPMSRGNARALAINWFGRSQSNGGAGTSAHDIFDPSEGVRMLSNNVIGYHVGPGGNAFTRGSEHCGRVALTTAQWLSPDGQEMLDRSARYNAAAAHRDGVIPRWLSLTQLRAKQSGFCTHNDIRLAFGGTTHSDPGPNFPYEWYMKRVQAYYNGTPIEEEDMPFTTDDKKYLGFVVGAITGANNNSLIDDVQPALRQGLDAAKRADGKLDDLEAKVASMDEKLNKILDHFAPQV